MVSYVTYLGQMLWPRDLAILYLHRGKKLPLESGIAAGLLLTGISLLALYWRRRRPYFIMGWLWYLGTLIPAIGLFRQVGLQGHADRYTYIPLIGIFIALSWGAAECAGRRQVGRWALGAVTAALLIACATVTASQVRYWRDSTSLANRALQVSGDDAHLHYIVAKGYLVYGYTELGVHHAEIVLQQRPDNWQSYDLYSIAMMQAGRIDEAAKTIARALALWPDSAVVHKAMAAVLWKQDRIPAAYEQLAVVAQLRPDSAEGQNYLGRQMQLQGDLKGAAGYFWEAVRLAPQRWEYRCDLAYVLEENGDQFDADVQRDTAFEIEPHWPAENDRWARILATHADAKRRDGAEAVRRSLQVCKVTRYQYAPFLETLAAAYAEAGLFKQAIETAARARNLAGGPQQKDLLKRLDRALSRYQNGEPFRDE